MMGNKTRRNLVVIVTLVIGLASVGFLVVQFTPWQSGEERYEGSMFLTDEPGNWFEAEVTGTPVLVIEPNGRVEFDIGPLTNTRHTVTLLIQPPGSTLEIDQEHSKKGKINATFRVPGVYLLICKVHPYMAGIVAVRDAEGNVPPVTREQLPFIGHLGVESLPAVTVISVLTNIAPSDADKVAKWDIFTAADEIIPAVPGIGEVWVDTQFETVPDQTDSRGVLKPGTITVVDAGTFTVEREINGLDPDAAERWNNPHNMWTDTSQSIIYNTHWFGKWLNKIERASGDILTTIVVGDAPTHVVTNPNEASDQFGMLTVPLSADDIMVKIRDQGDELKIVDKLKTGGGRNNPHGHWITADGTRIVVPNVFQGLGIAGSISIIDLETGVILKEITHEPQGLNSALLLPIAAGIKGSSKAYVSNLASGQVSVVDLETLELVKNIPVTFTPDGQQGAQFGILDTLQVPIQAPVSPDGRFVAVAVLSLTTIDRPPTGSADHVAIIDTATDTVVAFLATPSGTHGANWGAKLGGGYYAYITSQFSNALTIIDVDPNNDGSASDAAVVGRIVLNNGSSGAGVTDGTGGQGVKPLPNVYDGWIQDTVALSGTGGLSAEVQNWIDNLSNCQRDPSGPEC